MLQMDVRSSVPDTLYATDFDTPFPEPLIETAEEQSLSDQRPEAPAQISYTLADLEAAREEGRAEGREEQRNTIEQEKLLWLSDREQKALECLADIKRQMVGQVERLADKFAFAVMAALMEIFPSVITSYGDSERNLILRKIAPGFQNISKIRIETSSGEIEYMKKICQEAGALEIEVCISENMVTGDFQVSWEGGSAFRSAGAFAKEILSTIEEFSSKKTKG